MGKIPFLTAFHKRNAHFPTGNLQDVGKWVFPHFVAVSFSSSRSVFWSVTLILSWQELDKGSDGWREAGMHHLKAHFFRTLIHFLQRTLFLRFSLRGESVSQRVRWLCCTCRDVLGLLSYISTVIITVRMMLLGWCVVLIYNENLLVLYQQCKISKIGGQLGFCHVDKSSLAIFFSFRSIYILSSDRNKTSRKRRSYWEDWTMSAAPALQAVVFGWEVLSK